MLVKHELLLLRIVAWGTLVFSSAFTCYYFMDWYTSLITLQALDFMENTILVILGSIVMIGSIIVCWRSSRL